MKHQMVIRNPNIIKPEDKQCNLFQTKVLTQIKSDWNGKKRKTKKLIDI